MFFEILFSLFIVLILSYGILRKRFLSKVQYWSQKGVVQHQDIKFPMLMGGNMSATFLSVMSKRLSLHDISQRQYQEFKGKRYFGTYWPISGQPILTIRDLDLVQDVVVKDFDHFTDRSFGGLLWDKGTSKNDIIWNTSLFTIKGGNNWRLVRQTVNPAFTLSKMKIMLQLISPISDQFEVQFAEAAAKGIPADLGDLAEKLSLEAVSSCTFGVKAGSFEGKKQNQFCKKAYGLFVHDLMDFLYMLAMQIPFVKSVAYRFRMPINKPLHYIRDVLMNMLKHKKQGANKRNDLIDFMSSALTQKEGKIGSHEFDEVAGLSGDEFLMANAIALFVAAHDTTNVFLAYLFYELALNVEVQRRLQAEIDEAFKRTNTEGNMLEYGSIQALQYMDMVIKETLRKYTPPPLIPRTCTKEYTFPGTDLTIPEGTEVHIPIMAFHFDEEIFPNPHKFDPERFTPEATAGRHPMAYMPFGQGPRNCVGINFALLLAKVALVRVLRSNSLEQCEETPMRLTYHHESLFLRCKEKLLVRVEPREKKVEP